MENQRDNLFIEGGFEVNEQKLLCSLSYFSIFFAPFIVPIIIFFISTNDVVKYHAKRALLSHVLPVAIGILLCVMFLLSFGLFSEGNGAIFIIWPIIVGLFTLMWIGITIWNIVQGIRVLREL